jgi:hypothetical protein
MYQFQEGTKIYYSRGTGWIINKEPSTETNYRYWLATNFHVIASLPKTGTYAKLEYGSTTDSDGSTINLLSGYKNFNSFSIDKNLYSTTKTVTTSDDTPVTGNPGNDMVVIDVDFGNNPDTNVKLKLDKLNDEWDASGTEGQRHLNNFPDWNNYVISGAYHWGGYPVNNCAEEKLNTQQYAEWHTDEITNVKKNAGGEPAKDYWHPVKSTIYGTVVDVAPQIYSDTNKIDSKMGGGASGSMLIDRAKNVVGIYWGGWGVTGITFNPYFDIFNNSDFSYFNTADTFLSDYMFT